MEWHPRDECRVELLASLLMNAWRKDAAMNITSMPKRSPGVSRHMKIKVIILSEEQNGKKCGLFEDACKVKGKRHNIRMGICSYSLYYCSKCLVLNILRVFCFTSHFFRRKNYSIVTKIFEE